MAYPQRELRKCLFSKSVGVGLNYYLIILIDRQQTQLFQKVFVHYNPMGILSNANSQALTMETSRGKQRFVEEKQKQVGDSLCSLSRFENC